MFFGQETHELIHGFVWLLVSSGRLITGPLTTHSEFVIWDFKSFSLFGSDSSGLEYLNSNIVEAEIKSWRLGRG